ncbi:hypothetical protein C8F04DRAFT_1186260 [Mycena alexandri]|uniref:Uncharacterized protein n=1 Tax=Mycena alexandri TaxID=1745969 RepID=A0AAD6SN74_9AGAR|nr:hypothetical protein C8F04DRAFT_1186260 [Mycena alexandri]
MACQKKPEIKYQRGFNTPCKYFCANPRDYLQQKGKICDQCRIFCLVTHLSGTVEMSNWLNRSRVTPPVDLNVMVQYTRTRVKTANHGRGNTPSWPPSIEQLWSSIWVRVALWRRMNATTSDSGKNGTRANWCSVREMSWGNDMSVKSNLGKLPAGWLLRIRILVERTFAGGLGEYIFATGGRADETPPAHRFRPEQQSRCSESVIQGAGVDGLRGWKAGVVAGSLYPRIAWYRLINGCKRKSSCLGLAAALKDTAVALLTLSHITTARKANGGHHRIEGFRYKTEVEDAWILAHVLCNGVKQFNGSDPDFDQNFEFYPN